MKVIDLTHTISEDMPVYPGTEPPKLQQANTYEVDGFKETLMSMYSHTGTHMDPPNHLFADRTTLDAFPAEQFVGKALVIDCRDLGEGDTITIDRIKKYGKKAEATNKKGVGLDVIGIDPIPDEDLPIHKRLFREHEIVNIENLKNLDKCGDDLFWFFALPLKWEKADGAPIRAVAFWE